MILLSTEKWISLWISNICKKDPEESRFSAEFRFKQRVWNAKVEDRLKVINENSICKFEKITDSKYKTKDCFWNIEYLYIK